MSPVAEKIRTLWNVIETELDQHAPLILKSLNPGATEDLVAQLEGIVGLSLPEDMRQSLLVHDGQSPKISYLDGTRMKTGAVSLFETNWLLPVESIISFWTSMRDLAKGDLFDVYRCDWPGLQKDSRIKHVNYWNTGWIPITDSEGDFFCSDLAPAAMGCPGQVFHFCNGDHWPRGDGVRPWLVLAPNYTTWLAMIASLLTEGRYQVDASGRTIWFEPEGAFYTI